MVKFRFKAMERQVMPSKPIIEQQQKKFVPVHLSL
jgi:hypothetical protein